VDISTLHRVQRGMRTTPIFFIVVLILALPLSAQSHRSAGFSVGQQPYENFVDDPRYLPGVEVLLRGRTAGLHVALEYTDLEEVSAFIALHPDIVARWSPSAHTFVMAGAGPTIYSFGGESLSTTWNAEAEVGVLFGRMEVFARVRYYDFALHQTRGGEDGPDGPAIYAGARWAF
jgi:hypothetical protein